MADLGAFAEDNFDPKAYINAACANKPADQVLDRYLAELEMKLHLGSEDISLYLQDQATRATQRIPMAARELARIREDAQGVRASVSTALSKLQEDASHGSIAATLASLEELDTVKQHMEAACSTLKEAAGLSTLFSLVDDLFASGDFTRVADALAGIRRGLAVVADSVPEFRNGRERLAILEDRFAAAAEKPLIAALTNQRGDEASSLAGMLSAMNRTALVESSYIAARSAPLWALWEGYTAGTPFVSWIATIYDQLLHSIAAECQWCSSCLPEHYPNVVISLLTSFFTAIDKPYRARLAGALTGAQGSLLPLEHLEQAAAAATDFMKGLRRELVAAGAWQNESGLPLLVLVVAPVENAILQYHGKELQYLTAEMPRLLAQARDATSQPHALPAALNDSIDPAFAAVSAALARCVKLTGGTALPVLSRVLDRVVQQYISAVQTAIQATHGSKIGGAAAGAVAKPGAAVSQESKSTLSTPETVLPLLMVISRLQRRMEESAAGIKQSTLSIIPEILEAPSPSETSLDQPLPLSALRLQAQPALRQQLVTFVSTLAAADAIAMPSSSSALEDLVASVDALAEKALCGRVIGLFSSVSTLPELQAKPATSVQIPTFTPYPLQYITAAGEYLMMLPQLLESALASEAASEVQGEGAEAVGSPVEGGGGAQGDDGGDAAVAAQLVSEWVDRAALAASYLYLGELKKIRSLTAQGSSQLGADIEYFSNVLSTLGLAGPPALAAWQAALVAPDAATLESLKTMAAEESGSAEAKAVVDIVAKLRALELTGGSGGAVAK